MNTVKVLRRKNGLALVEWIVSDDAKRSWIPEADLLGDLGTTANVDYPEQGIPFDGIPWEEIIVLAASPETVAKELRRRGIWTMEDLRAWPDEARAAIQAASRLDLSALRQSAEQYLKVEA